MQDSFIITVPALVQKRTSKFYSYVKRAICIACNGSTLVILLFYAIKIGIDICKLAVQIANITEVLISDK